MKLVIRTPWSNRPKYPGRTFTGISIAVPDLAMSIQEILTRYQRGLPIIGEKVPLYDEHESIDAQRLDLAEIEELRDRARQQYLERKKKFDNEQRERAKQKQAQQGPKVQRTTGDADDQGPIDQPDNPISEKNRPAGEANTGKSAGKNKQG